MAYDTNRRYIWLLKSLLDSGGLTLAELQAKWEKSSENDAGKDFKERTFHQHKNAVMEMFDVNIICDPHDGYRYKVENADQVSRDNLNRWLLESASVSATISDCKDIKDRIILEPIAGGTQFLTEIVQAIRESKTLQVKYQSFEMKQPRTFTLYPYSLKNFQHRWYLLATNAEQKTVRKYALERMLSVEKTDASFKMPKGFNPTGYYENCIGINIKETDTPSKIVLRIFGKMQPYVETCPLHHSQTKISETDAYTDYQYRLIINNDLLRQLLSHEDQVEVLEPASLRTQMKKEALRILKKYE